MITDRHQDYTVEVGRFRANFASNFAARDRNPELTLSLAVFFRQVPAGTNVPYDPSNPAGPKFAARAWPNNAVWQRFKQTVLGTSQRFWNGKFWLIPPRSTWKLCSFLPERPLEQNVADNRRYAAHAQPCSPASPEGNLYSFNVYCRTDVHEAANAANAHIIFDVPYVPTGLNDSPQFINFADAAGTHQGRLESGVLEPRQLDGSSPIPHMAHHRHYQRQYIHEIGHALGQRHIGFITNDTMCEEVPAHLTTATHDHCYQGNREEDERNIMGKGERLTKVNARPWLTVMARVTGVPDWLWRPEMKRVYPRFVGKSQLKAL